MLRYQQLLKERHDEIATVLAQETGKTFEDAKGDVWRGIEVVEQAANIAPLLMGETVENVAGASTPIPCASRWVCSAGSRPSTFRP